MIKVNYGQFDSVLRASGFVTHEPKKGTRVYTYPDSEALIAIPIRPESEQVSNFHLMAAKMTVDADGIADPDELAARLVIAGGAFPDLTNRPRRPDGLRT